MYGDRQNICQVLQKSDHRKEKAMEIRKNSGPLKWVLIGISTLFLIVMLILPLTYVLVTAFGEGIKVFVAAVTDYYALKAIGLTLEVTLIAVVVNTIFGIAASWCITRFQFHGKKILSTLIDLPLTISPVIAGLIYILTFGRQSILYEYLRSAGIKLIFAVPGIVVATVFVTFPFISREIIPVLSTLGTDEEEAAALMGANGFTISGKLPSHISNGHCFTESCSVRQERWESLVRYLFCPVTFREKQIRCRFTLNFCIRDMILPERLRYRRS